MSDDQVHAMPLQCSACLLSLCVYCLCELYHSFIPNFFQNTLAYFNIPKIEPLQSFIALTHVMSVDG